METLKHFLDVLAQPMGMLGLLGQVLFFSRFLVQWIASEKKGRSTIPLSFWYLSIGGGGLLLVYAIWRRDPGGESFQSAKSVGLRFSAFFSTRAPSCSSSSFWLESLA